MLSVLIVVAVWYVLTFVVLRFRYRARPGRTSRRAKVLPWNGHLYIEAATDAQAADALLRADLELAARGR